MTKEGDFPDLCACHRLNRTQFSGKIDLPGAFGCSRDYDEHNQYASLPQTLIETAPRTEL
jgi:hypothetical protein